MYIPSHYVFLFVAIFLGESATIFVYTVIGLIKANPLPYFVPSNPDFPLCRYANNCRPYLSRTLPYFEANPPLQPQVMQSKIGPPIETVAIYQTGNGIASNTRRVEGLLPAAVETVEGSTIPSSLQISAVATPTMLTESLTNGATSTTTVNNTPMAVTSLVLLTTVASFTPSHPPRSTIFETVVLPLPSSSAK